MTEMGSRRSYPRCLAADFPSAVDDTCANSRPSADMAFGAGAARRRRWLSRFAGAIGGLDDDTLKVWLLTALALTLFAAVGCPGFNWRQLSSVGRAVAP